MKAPSKLDVSIGLSAAIVSVADERPGVLVVHHAGQEDALPFGPFDPLAHRTLDGGLRKWVEEQTHLELGYAEQLYTFGDRGRHLPTPGEDSRVVSVGYLALTRQLTALKATDNYWGDWYKYFPWEAWRDGPPAVIDKAILPALKQFAKGSDTARDRVRLCFGTDDLPWDEEKVLERYELLYEAGLVREAVRDGRKGAPIAALGESMMFDHRRILATAIARLRGKMKYRPVVFELMPDEFTLTELQRTVEAISGRHLHKQNFRRLVESAAVVEPTGETSTTTGGRPAARFRFRRDVVQERPAPGLRLGGRS